MVALLYTSLQQLLLFVQDAIAALVEMNLQQILLVLPGRQWLHHYISLQQLLLFPQDAIASSVEMSLQQVLLFFQNIHTHLYNI